MFIRLQHRHLFRHQTSMIFEIIISRVSSAYRVFISPSTSLLALPFYIRDVKIFRVSRATLVPPHLVYISTLINQKEWLL